MNYPSNLISGIRNLYSVLCHLSSDLCFLTSVFCSLISSYVLRVACYELRVTGYGLRVTDCVLRVTGCASRVRGKNGIALIEEFQFLPSVICHLFSVLRPLSSVFCSLASALCPILYHSAFRLPTPEFQSLSSDLCPPTSDLCHLNPEPIPCFSTVEIPFLPAVSDILPHTPWQGFESDRYNRYAR